MSVPLWVAILVFVFGGLGTGGSAFAILRSRYRVQTEDEREKYIKALESRNELLERTNERQAVEISELKHSQSALEGQMKLLGQLVIGKCSWADIDPDTGKCRHCDRSFTFGGGER